MRPGFVFIQFNVLKLSFVVDKSSFPWLQDGTKAKQSRPFWETNPSCSPKIYRVVCYNRTQLWQWTGLHRKSVSKFELPEKTPRDRWKLGWRSSFEPQMLNAFVPAREHTYITILLVKCDENLMGFDIRNVKPRTMERWLVFWMEEHTSTTNWYTMFSINTKLCTVIILLINKVKM